jgi:hypothetical protein
MKVILRNLRTGLYFQGGATWTRHAEKALAYSNIERALAAAYDSMMSGLEVNVLLFDDPHCTVRLALDAFLRQHGAEIVVSGDFGKIEGAAARSCREAVRRY